MRVVANSCVLDGYVATANGTTGTVGAAFRIENMTGCSLSITGSSNAGVVGTAVVQGSNDRGVSGGDDYSGVGVTNWTTFPNSGQTATQSISGTSTIIFNLDGLYCKWVRVLISWTAGGCVLTVRATGKGV